MPDRDLAHSIGATIRWLRHEAGLSQRIYGTVDFKRSRYVFLPESAIRQALFVDSKAEKETRAATIQMSQTSMEVRQMHSGDEVRVPNGLIQERYNPNVNDGFWGAGRNAPSLGENFRVRVNFRRLRARTRWRVQRIGYNSAANRCSGEWQE